MLKKILIAGASGLIGPKLRNTLKQAGHQVNVLTRDKNESKRADYFYWDTNAMTMDPKALEDVNVIINLAGAPIAAKRWTEKRKQEIVQSRTAAAATIFSALKANQNKVEKYISASAVGYYGSRGSELLTEESKSGDDFLARCCIAWELAADEGTALGIDVVKIRTGLVLSGDGGALKPMEKAVKFYAGTPLGNGTQWMPWIHIDDLVNLYLHALANNSVVGVYNASAPMPVTNWVFTQNLADILNKPFWPIKTPALVLRIALGQMADLVLSSNNTSSDKIVESGFDFKYENLAEALKAIYR